MRQSELPLSPPLFLLAVFASAALAALLVWSLVDVPVLALAGAIGGAYAPVAWAGGGGTAGCASGSGPGRRALAQLADALEAGIAFPAGVALVAETGPRRCEETLPASTHGFAEVGLPRRSMALRNRASGPPTRSPSSFAPACSNSRRAGSRRCFASSLAFSPSALRRAKARSRASSLQLEAAILALSPIVLLLLIGLASPAYLEAYRTPGGTLVGSIGGLLIFGCYLLMVRLGRVPEPRRTGEAR